MSSYGYDVNSCPDGLVLKEVWEGGGPSLRIYKKCVAPNTESDCPANTKFTKEPVPSGITVIGGDGFQNRCRPYTDADNPKKVECNDGSFDVSYGIKAPCSGNAGGVKVNPVEKVVDAIKPKTEEEEYRNFIFLAMAAVGVYLILSE